MKESSTYQAILKEGREEGKLSEARKLFLQLGRRFLGNPPEAIQARIEQISDLDQLEQLLGRIGEVSNWDELLPPSKPRRSKRRKTDS